MHIVVYDFNSLQTSQTICAMAHFWSNVNCYGKCSLWSGELEIYVMVIIINKILVTETMTSNNMPEILMKLLIQSTINL